MLNLINEVIGRHRTLVVNEADLIRVLRVVQTFQGFKPAMEVFNCGWANYPEAWGICVNANNVKWRKICRELHVIRVFENKDIPNRTRRIYTTD